MKTSLLLAPLALLALAGCADRPRASALPIGDEPAVARHLSQAAIDAGQVPLDSLLEAGRSLFAASFNTLDGAGRPGSTGTGMPRAHRAFPENFNRISGPDANSCAGCHSRPFLGGGGDNVANVFVLGQRFPFVNFDPAGEGDGFQAHTLESVANERNTLGMFGAGLIELLAREMTVELQALRARAAAQARTRGSAVTLDLRAKGVGFGTITARPDGGIETSGVRGVDPDLVVKPFHQKGVVVSLREFTVNAVNHHHGMQAAERVGAGNDPDGDGKADELTAGDITALTLFQATLPAPGRVLPRSPALRSAAAHGEALFSAIGCASCHVPALVLEDPRFTEPGPFNPPGTLSRLDVEARIAVDLARVGPGRPLGRRSDGSVLVPAFTDLKRHDLGPELDNEKLVQAGVPTSQFLTRKLWGMANEPPFMHHGRALTIGEAVRMHGGEAQAARQAFDALPAADQADLVEFLETLQVLPPGSSSPAAAVAASELIGDEPVVKRHVEQGDIDAGRLGAAQLFELGRFLFEASFNTLDGACRPTTTGAGKPRPPELGTRTFNRLSAPDANACAGCHALPRTGGGGDNVANVFVLAQRLPFLNFDAGAGEGFETHRLDAVADERNTLGMFGAGFIELLGREMTAELQAIRAAALDQARAAGVPVRLALRAKGIDFGSIGADPDGSIDTHLVRGVDPDLRVKPFHQKGVVVSLREFTNNAMNHHHGMQTVERFGGNSDPDGDGQPDELTVGDVTALTLFQALLPVPGRVLPAHPGRRRAVEDGEALFEAIGCTGCHVPALRLASPVFTEPSHLNPPGNLAPADVSRPFAVDLTVDGPGPHLPRLPDGSVLVPAYTDLKRHDLGAELDNEKVVHAGVPTSQFITRKLWGMANEPPFLHHGRATTIDEAIRRHGGEAQGAREAYLAASEAARRSIVDFLKTLQVLPEGSALEVVQ